MSSVVAWLGKYWNVILLLFLVVGALLLIVLWPGKAEEELVVQVEPHMNPVIPENGEVNELAVYGVLVLLLVVCGYFLLLWFWRRRKK